MFLLDNHKSMQDYPEYLPEAFTPGYYPTPVNPGPGDLGGEGPAGLAINTGCSDPALVSAMSWFDKGSPDPAKNGSVAYDSDPFFYTPFFEPNRFYFSRGRRIGWQVEDFPYSLSYDFAGLNGQSDAMSACYAGVNWDFTNYSYSPMSPLITECMSCLQAKGWWRGPIVTSNTANGQGGPQRAPDEAPLPPEAFRKWIVSGRVLNVRPPKFVVARKVLKDAISTAANVRMSVATFGQDHGWFDPPELLAPVRPNCDLSYPTINETALDRPRLRNAVNRTLFRNNERSVGEALFGLGGYFSSQKVDNRWADWFQQPISPGWFGWPGCCNGGTYDSPYTGTSGLNWGVDAQEWLKPPFYYSYPDGSMMYLPGQPWEGVGADRSVCFSAQNNAVIVVTGGTPFSDNTVPITKMMDILLAHGAQHPDGTPLTFDPSNPETNTNPGGVNYCNQFQKDWTGAHYTLEDCDYTEYNWPTGLARTNKNFMDDVAFFLANTDLRDDMVGDQTVRTYVIDYRDSSPMLMSIAKAGKGVYYRANSPSELRDSLTDILMSLQPPAGSTP